MADVLPSDFGLHCGYLGAFTRAQAPGALASGTRIIKVRTDPGDTHAVGAKGTVLGSLYSEEKGFAYFIEWDDRPKFAVLTTGWKVGPLN